MSSRRNTILRQAVFALALLCTAVALWRLETPRAGVEITDAEVGTTPVTYYSRGDAPAPVVVVAHGFAGSRPLMESFSLTLAQAGYFVAAFDYEGHGKNPVPMSGDVDAIEGTTALLVAETLRVLDAALAQPGAGDGAALLGHSMASDLVIRAGLRDDRVDTVIAVSMFSQAVTAEAPRSLLAITGEWEPGLRDFAREAVRMVDPGAAEGETVRSGDVVRRAAVAPNVEHVGVLYSTTSLVEARAWLDDAFGRTSTAPLAHTGPWLALLLFSLVALAWPLAGLVPQDPHRRVLLTRGQFALAVMPPALVAPLGATQIDLDLLPILVADYLMVHLALQGILQLAILWRLGVRPGRLHPLALAALLVWGLGVFGLALDRYGASFWPIPERLSVIAVIAVGAVPFMLADALTTLGTAAGFWRRMLARAAFLGSLGLAVALDFERLFFLVLILPVIVLYYIVFGLMGRWVGLRAGATTAGVALGLILAWSLGVSFPLFDAGL